jgi:hypothetical protein
MKLSDRQGLDEHRAHFRGDDEQPIRLAVVGGELGEELVVGDSGRRCQPGFGADFSPDFFRALRRPPAPRSPSKPSPARWPGEDAVRVNRVSDDR